MTHIWPSRVSKRTVPLLCCCLFGREEEAAAASATDSAATASGAGGNKRKRLTQKGVDAILELGPRDRGAESAEEEDPADDPFGERITC